MFARTCDELVMQREVKGMLSRRHRGMTGKIVSMLDEILQLAFLSDKNIKSIRAYDILSTKNSILIEKLSISSFFSSFFQTRFEKASDCLLYRFIGLIENIIVFADADMEPDGPLSFFNDLLKYVKRYPVQVFLKRVVHVNDQIVSFQRAIKIGGFVDAITTRIQESSDFEEKSDLFGVLSFVVQNPIFESEFQNLEFFDTVVDIESDSAEQWCCLSNLVNEENVYEYSTLIPAAISVVCEKDRNYFHEYQVHALNFISSTLVLDSAIQNDYNPMVFVSIVLDIFKNHSNNTIALQAAESASIVLMKSSKILPVFCKNFRPFIEEVISNNNNVIQKAFIMHIIQFVINTKSTEPEIFDELSLPSFIIGQANKWNDIISSPYGNEEVDDMRLYSPPIEINLPRTAEIY